MINFFKEKLVLRSKSKYSALFEYLKTYIIIILILCIGTGLIYGLLTQSLKNQIINVNNVLLQNTLSSIEKEFANMNQLISLVNSNPRVVSYLNMSQNVKPNAESYNAYEVIKDLNTYVYSNKFVKGINIFFNNETVITNEYKAGYELYFNDLNKTQIDHKSIISEYNHRNLVYERDTEGSLCKLYYVNSLPVGSRKNWKATVVIEMDLDIISAFLQNNQFTERTETVLRNSEQKIILTHNPMTAKSNNINAIRTQAKSEILGWEIESIIPKTEFEEKLMSIRSVIISILLLSLLVVLIFASYFAYRHNRPIARLIGLVHEETMDIIKEDIFSHIEESISKTINENKELKRKIMKQTEYLTDNAVEKLLKKEIQSIKDSENMMDVPYIKLKSAKFVVFSIKLYINSLKQVIQ